MKNVFKSFMAIIAVVGILASTAPATLAHDDHPKGKGFEKELHRGLHKGWHKKRHKRPHLVSKEIRKEMREDYRSWDEEQQAEYREARKEHREERRVAFEEFVGMTREEIREARKEGQTLADILTEKGETRETTGEFLTSQANEHIDFIDEHHDLDDEQEQTLRDRVAGFVGSILDRIFGKE